MSWFAWIGAVFVLASAGWLVLDAENGAATHYYGSTLELTDATPAEDVLGLETIPVVEVTGTQVWRNSIFGTNFVGNCLSGEGVLRFSNGATESYGRYVSAIDVTNDRATVEIRDQACVGPVRHLVQDLGATTSLTVSWNSCCRLPVSMHITEHVNNPNAFYHLEASIDLTGHQSGPRFDGELIQSCPVNDLCIIDIPAVDPEGDAMNYRLSDTAAGAGTFYQPGPDCQRCSQVENALFVTPEGDAEWHTQGAGSSSAQTERFFSVAYHVDDGQTGMAIDTMIKLDPFVAPPAASFLVGQSGTNYHAWGTYDFTDVSQARNPGSAPGTCPGGQAPQMNPSTGQWYCPGVNPVSIVGWYWDFGDGSTSTEQNPTYTYTDAGTYNVTLTVTQSNGLKARTSQVIEARPVIISSLAWDGPVHARENATAYPEADIHPGYSVRFARLLTFSGSPSSQDFVPGSGESKTVYYQQAGTFGARVYTYVDGNQNTTFPYGYDYAIFEVDVLPARPVAQFAATPNPATTGESIAFNWTGYAGDSAITGIAWSFGDGSEATGYDASHQYAHPGNYTVTVTATDANGYTRSANDVIQVQPAVPVASFDVSANQAFTYENLQFTSTSSPGYAPIASTLWGFGDGTFAQTPSASHAYAEDGIYTVSLRVTDARGYTDTAYATVIIVNQGPTVAWDFTSKGTTATFVDGSLDADGTIASWSWDFGDGAISNEASPVHKFKKGSYEVTLTVTDNDGAWATMARTIVLPAPKA